MWIFFAKLIKVAITPLLSQLQGWPGWQKNGTMLRNSHLVFFSARIEPKMKIIRKTVRKQGFFGDFFSNFDSFLQFTHFWLNSSAKTQQIYLEKKNGFFDTQAKLYIPSTLNIDLILWHTQLIVCA